VRDVNTLKSMLMKGRVPVGIFVTLNSPLAAEAMAYAGFDFVILDMEHFPTDLEAIHGMVQATRGSGATPVVRVPWNEGWLIRRALDTGAYGVVVPQVNTKEEAISAVRAARYAPEGSRGFGPYCASLRWGMSVLEYASIANMEVSVIILIETVEGVENVDEVVSTPGIDMVLQGPVDLAASMGSIDLQGSPEHNAALKRIYEACKGAHVPVAAYVTSMETLRQGIASGYDAIVVATDLDLLLNGANDIVTCARQAKGC